MRRLPIGCPLKTNSAVVLAMICVLLTAGIGGAAVGANADSGRPAEAADQVDPREPPVRLESDTTIITSGEVMAHDVVVTTSTKAVGVYDVAVDIAASRVASVSDVTLNEQSHTVGTPISIADNGSSVDLTGVLATTSDTASMTIATITLQGNRAGPSDLELAGEALGTVAGNLSLVTDTPRASLTDTATERAQPSASATTQVSNSKTLDGLRQEGLSTVAADVTDGANEKVTQPVDARVETDNDSTLPVHNTRNSQNVTSPGSEFRTVSFSNLHTSRSHAETLTYRVFIVDDSTTGTNSTDTAAANDTKSVEDESAQDAEQKPSSTDNDEPEETDSDTPNSTPRDTPVRLEPSNSSVPVGTSTSYDVIVESADGGVGAYEFTLTLDDPSVASVTDLELGGNPPMKMSDVTFAADGSSVSGAAVLADTNDTGRVTIATTTITGDSAGTSNLSLAVAALGTEAGDSYTVTETPTSSITVTADTLAEPAPADVDVSNRTVPNTTTQGDNITVSTNVTNTGVETATKAEE